MSEYEYIAAIKAGFSLYGIELDSRDDCGYPDSVADVVTTDSLVEGRHFCTQLDTMFEIGKQAAVVNLSDLASSGARPTWLVWALSIPTHWNVEHLGQLARGFASEAAQYDVAILGGNLSSIDGPAVINVTAAGARVGNRSLRRSDGQVGDTVYLSGVLGQGSLGYREANDENRRARHRWRPHINEGIELAQIDGINACMDVSDGLLIDAGRIASASKLCISLSTHSIPVVGEPEHAIRGGEDYVLLFTARPDADVPSWAHPIGHCIDGRGVLLDERQVATSGFDHFEQESS
ncbi:MAG: thiamine-phosphate kinase [Bradymonadia bacterium]